MARSSRCSRSYAFIGTPLAQIFWLSLTGSCRQSFKKLFNRKKKSLPNIVEHSLSSSAKFLGQGEAGKWKAEDTEDMGMIHRGKTPDKYIDVDVLIESPHACCARRSTSSSTSHQAEARAPADDYHQEDMAFTLFFIRLRLGGICGHVLCPCWVHPITVQVRRILRIINRRTIH